MCTTAAALRAKDCVMATATGIREGRGGHTAEAKQLNEKYAAEAEAEVIEDSAEKAE